MVRKPKGEQQKRVHFSKPSRPSYNNWHRGTMKRNGQMKHVGCGGRTTSSSVPGGLFAAPPEPQQRSRLDGMAGGRGNSSSVVGGVFGAEPPTYASSQQRPARHATTSSVSGGIFGGGTMMGPPPAAAASPWEGAAGGRSTNASQVFGHKRAHLNGGSLDGV